MILRIGLDFDNTIVDYNTLFFKVAREQGLIPASLSQTKSSVRDYLRQIEREDDWTRLQGYVYGERMLESDLFPGTLNFLSHCRKQAIPVFIISHKTRYPYLGPQYDLHQSALKWMKVCGLFDPTQTALTQENVFLELSKESKLQRIAALRCNVFLDDLPEFLTEPAFPVNVARFLFDPQSIYFPDSRYCIVKSWGQFAEIIGGMQSS